MNNVSAIGRLTEDPPEVITTLSGKKVLEVRMAINRPNRPTVFVDVKAWGATAENVREYLAKGSLVGVTGELARDEWTDRATGEPRSKHFVNARRVEFLDQRLKPPAAPAAAPPATEIA